MSNSTSRKSSKSSFSLAITGTVTAIAASLCCITPVLALVAGISGAASVFSWIEPARPYLMGLAIASLGFAWYQKIRSAKVADMDCACESPRQRFWRSKKLLAMVTAFAIVMMAFPYYSGWLLSAHSAEQSTITENTHLTSAPLSVDGMTCTGCEKTLDHALATTPGVVRAESSYQEGAALIQFDSLKTSLDSIIVRTSRQTGYEITKVAGSEGLK